MIGDILVKVAQKQPLSIIEEMELEDWGRMREETNKFLFSLQDGTGRINADHIEAVNGLFRWQPYGLSSKVRFSQSIPNNFLTDVTVTEIVYDEIGGFTVGSATMNTKQYSWYEINIFCDWEQASGGIRSCSITSSQRETLNSPEVAPITNHLWDMRRHSPPPLKVQVFHTSGANLNCSGTIRVQLLSKAGVFSD